MAVTSEWEWENVTRARDYTISRNINFFRENWVLARKIISNDTFSSELGATASTLSAYNGGVTETISPPSFSFFKFTSSGASFWTINIPFYKAGYQRNGKDAYLFSEASPKDPSKAAVIFYEYNQYFGGTYYHWHWIQCSSGEASSGTFPTMAAIVTASNHVASSQTNSATPAGSAWKREFNNLSSHTATLSSSSSTVDFLCLSDAQQYDNQSVDWYTQRQQWVARSPWS
jgi:hypothetical protein